MNEKTFTVPNISCNHCVHTVKMEVGDIAGVQRVEADAHAQPGPVVAVHREASA